MHGLRLFLLLLFLSLPSCMSAALTGAEAVYKHDAISEKTNDEWTKIKIYRAMYHNENLFFADSHIVLAVYDNKLLLAGQASKNEQKTRAEEIAKQFSEDRKIYNFIEISPPTASLTRVSDHWITTKVTGRFIAEKQFPASKINVFTENGTVFLMGSITVDEADRAVQITQRVDGIQRIIKVFTLYQKVNAS